MSVMVEKALVVGLGVFTVIIFSALFFPFLISINEFNNKIGPEFDEANRFINNIDSAIKFVIENPDDRYVQTVSTESHFNVSCNIGYVHFSYTIKGKIYNRRLSYPQTVFEEKGFEILTEQVYLLTVINEEDIISISFS